MPSSPIRPSSARGPGRPAPRGRVVGVGAALVIIAAAVIGVLVRVFSHTARGQVLEDRVVEGIDTSARVDSVLNGGLGLVSVGAIVLALLLLGTYGALRKRHDLAIAAAVMVGGANITTQVLKYQVLERTDHGWSGPNTLPSGHVTVITSVLVAVLFVVPWSWRPRAVPVVGFLATCAGVGTVVLRWHRPSDVIAAYAVVMAWTGLVVAGLAVGGRLRRRESAGGDRMARYTSGAVVAGVLVGLLILGAGVAPVSGRKDLLLAVGALAVVALACAAAVALSSYALDLLGDDPEPDRAAREMTGAYRHHG